MNDLKGFDWNDPGLRAPSPEERQTREAGGTAHVESSAPAAPSAPPDPPTQLEPLAPPAPAFKPLLPAGSLLPKGSALPMGVGILGHKTVDAEWEHLAPPPPPRPAPSKPASPAPVSPTSLSTATRTQQPSTFQRAVNVFRAAMPLVQRVLPLLDGNVGAAVSNLMAPRPQTTPPPPPVNLVPIESGMARLQVQHRELRDQIVEQNTSLKKVEDQLQQVREATDRNTLEQQELLEDLKSVGTKVNIFAYIGLALLGVSVLLNILLFLQLRHLLP
jgi:hypothetical protein